MPPPDDRPEGRMRDTLDRRTFLRRAGLAIPASVAGLIAACTDEEETPSAPVLGANRGQGNGGYGPVDQDAGILRLPKGFHVEVLGRIGDPMSDGSPTPTAFDGMACFAHGPSRYRLVRNHEDRNPPPFPPIGVRPYDPTAGGGTTTLEVGRDRRLRRSWV